MRASRTCLLMASLLLAACGSGAPQDSAPSGSGAAPKASDKGERALLERNARCRDLVSRAQFEEGMPLCLAVLEDAAEENESGLPFAQAVANSGLMFHMRGQYDDAAAFYERAVGLLERLGDEARPVLARTLGDYGLMDAQRGRAGLGLPRLQRARELLLEDGASPGETLAALNGDLAEAYELDGQLAEAERWYRQSLEAYRDATGNSANTGVAMNNLATLYQRLERFDQAEALLNEAIALLEDQLPADHPVLNMARSNLRDNAELRAEAASRAAQRETGPGTATPGSEKASGEAEAEETGGAPAEP